MATPGYDATYNLGLRYTSDAAMNHNLDLIDQKLGAVGDTPNEPGLEARVSALEVKVADLETRVAALESA